MAYADGKLLNVSVHENGNYVRQWIYKENATVAAIAASGYFNSATGKLAKGDIIIIQGNNGTGMAQVTSATAAATVTVGAFTALS